jgi:hypothetical protein
VQRVFDSKFPVGGIDNSRSFAGQSPRPLPTGQWDITGKPTIVPGLGVEQEVTDVWGRTTHHGVNVRGFEASEKRRRGGTRPGTSQYVPQAVVPGWIIQELNKVVTVGGGAVQLSQMGRVVWLVAGSQGNIYYARAGDTVWAMAVNASGDTPPMNFSGIYFSAANGQKLWMCDGSNYKYFDPATVSVYQWTATAGSMPVDDDHNTARLIANWRGRIVLAGFFRAPQILYMSAVDDPTNWDFAPVNYTPTQAFATSVGPQNSPGAPITGILPFNDDVLLVGTDHELWLVNGDPQAGGQISLITNAIGMAWGESFCLDPYGTAYFFSNKTGVYSITPGQQPLRISQAVEQLLQAVDTGNNGIRMVWDDQFQGVHIFVTPYAAPAAAQHYFYEARTGAWWIQVFGNNNHNPLAVCDFDGNTNTDRSVVMGSWDGFVRFFDSDAPDDDGTPIVSEVWLGPILSKTFDEMRVDEMVADLGETSGSVRWDLYPGLTAEAALAAGSIQNGLFVAGRNAADPVRVAAHALWGKLSSTKRWAFERLRFSIQEKGPTTGRRK